MNKIALIKQLREMTSTKRTLQQIQNYEDKLNNYVRTGEAMPYFPAHPVGLKEAKDFVEACMELGKAEAEGESKASRKIPGAVMSQLQTTINYIESDVQTLMDIMKELS